MHLLKFSLLGFRSLEVTFCCNLDTYTICIRYLYNLYKIKDGNAITLLNHFQVLQRTEFTKKKKKKKKKKNNKKKKKKRKQQFCKGQNYIISASLCI